MMNNRSHWLFHREWEDELAGFGFSKTQGSRSYSLNGVFFSTEGIWAVLKTKSCDQFTDPLRDQMGWPGLWKPTMEGRCLWRIFELPLSIQTEEVSNQSPHEEPPLLRSLLHWALQTLDGPPHQWQPPPFEEVAEMVPRDELTIQCGSHARQGELFYDSTSLALQVPVIGDIPKGLSSERHFWLRRLLMEGQNTWRMVRVGFVGGLSGLSVAAEVNLTGAPTAALPELLKISLAALRYVVGWILGSALFVVDSKNGCRALERSPFQPGIPEI